jgi:hypothetical protein
MISVLPPPPKYSTQASYNAALAAGTVPPMIETNNVLNRPTGPEYQLLVGEGEHLFFSRLMTVVTNSGVHTRHICSQR